MADAGADAFVRLGAPADDRGRALILWAALAAATAVLALAAWRLVAALRRGAG